MCYLEYLNAKDDLIICKCFCCHSNYHKSFDGDLKGRFANTYEFSNHDNNKSILLLQKVVYTYEDMHNWENFEEISLPEKEDKYRRYYWWGLQARRI